MAGAAAGTWGRGRAAAGPAAAAEERQQQQQQQLRNGKAAAGQRLPPAAAGKQHGSGDRQQQVTAAAAVAAAGAAAAAAAASSSQFVGSGSCIGSGSQHNQGSSVDSCAGAGCRSSSARTAAQHQQRTCVLGQGVRYGPSKVSSRKQVAGIQFCGIMPCTRKARSVAGLQQQASIQFHTGQTSCRSAHIPAMSAAEGCSRALPCLCCSWPMSSHCSRRHCRHLMGGTLRAVCHLGQRAPGPNYARVCNCMAHCMLQIVLLEPGALHHCGTHCPAWGPTGTHAAITHEPEHFCRWRWHS